MPNIGLLPVDQVHKRIAKHAKLVPSEAVPLRKASCRLLRAPIRADRNIPPFNRSAMDGYAVRSADFDGTTASLTEVANIPAGTEWTGRVTKGTCARIMTGAPVPKGADAVVMVERTQRGGDIVHVDDPKIGPWGNIHRRGADARKGQVLLKPGQLLAQGQVAVAASVGANEVEVARLINVAVISTGREVVKPSAAPSPFQIRDANGPALMAAVDGLPWCKGKALGIAPDTESGLSRVIAKALGQSDVILLTGGVSMGEFDLVPQILRQAGVKQVFHGAAVRPGKPLWFGAAERGQLVFGLPGNPISTRVGFREFVLPALRRMAGFAQPFPPSLGLPLGEDVKKKHDLTLFAISRLSVQSGRTRVLPVPHEGSGDLVSAAQSDGVFVFPAQLKSIEAGTPVEFHSWKT